MDPSNSTEETKISLTRNQKLVIGGLVAAILVSILGGLIYWWRPRADPPPIIVKSGSFVLEAYAEVEIQNGTGQNPDTVEYPNFQVSNVKIQRYNKDSATLYPLYDGAFETIKIWMEESAGMPTNPTFVFEQSGSNLKLSSTEKLKKGPNKHRARPYKIKDKDQKDFRFGKIKIGGNPEVIATDGDEFFIQFYRVPPTSPTPTAPPTTTVTPMPTMTPTVTATPSLTPSLTPTVTPSLTPTP